MYGYAVIRCIYIHTYNCIYIHSYMYVTVYVWICGYTIRCIYIKLCITVEPFSRGQADGSHSVSLCPSCLTELSDWLLVGLCGVLGTLCAPLPPIQPDTQPVTPRRPSSSSIYGWDRRTLPCYNEGSEVRSFLQMSGKLELEPTQRFSLTQHWEPLSFIITPSLQRHFSWKHPAGRSWILHKWIKKNKKNPNKLWS